MPVRVAVTGRTKSPGLFETLRVIGNERVQARVAAAIDRLRNEGETHRRRRGTRRVRTGFGLTLRGNETRGATSLGCGS